MSEDKSDADSVDLPPTIQLGINNYLNKKLVPTGFIATCFGFFIGFGVHDWAQSNAYSDALKAYSGQIADASNEVGRAVGAAENATKETDRLAKKAAEMTSEIEGLLKSSAQEKAKFSQILNTSETAKQIASILRGDEGFKKSIATAIGDRTQSSVDALGTQLNALKDAVSEKNDLDAQITQKSSELGDAVASDARRLDKLSASFADIEKKIDDLNASFSDVNNRLLKGFPQSFLDKNSKYEFAIQYSPERESDTVPIVTMLKLLGFSDPKMVPISDPVTAKYFQDQGLKSGNDYIVSKNPEDARYVGNVIQFYETYLLKTTTPLINVIESGFQSTASANVKMTGLSILLI